MALRDTFIDMPIAAEDRKPLKIAGNDDIALSDASSHGALCIPFKAKPPGLRCSES